MIRRLLSLFKTQGTHDKRDELPSNFPAEDDLQIALIEWEQTGSMLSTLRAVAEWRRQR
jgi:hypothetical protein